MKFHSEQKLQRRETAKLIAERLGKKREQRISLLEPGIRGRSGDQTSKMEASIDNCLCY